MVFQHRPTLGFAVSLGWVSRLVVDYVSVLAATDQDPPNNNRYSPVKWENITPKELVYK
jgi:hypothetical protein